MDTAMELFFSAFARTANLAGIRASALLPPLEDGFDNTDRFVILGNLLVLSTFVCAVLHFLSILVVGPLFFPHFRKLDTAKRAEWGSRVVSSIHAIESALLSMRLLTSTSSIRNDYLSGAHPEGTVILTITAGYLLWDLILVVYYRMSDFTRTVMHHAFGTVCMFSAGYYNQCIGYSLYFVFTEISTPFVNFRWFFDVAGMKTSMAYLVNGLLIVIIFFAARIAPMPYIYYNVFYVDFFRMIAIRPVFIAALIIMGALAGLYLNLTWFKAIFKGAIKALRAQTGTTKGGPSKSSSSSASSNPAKKSFAELTGSAALKAKSK